MARVNTRAPVQTFKWMAMVTSVQWWRQAPWSRLAASQATPPATLSGRVVRMHLVDVSARQMVGLCGVHILFLFRVGFRFPESPPALRLWYWGGWPPEDTCVINRSYLWGTREVCQHGAFFRVIVASPGGGATLRVLRRQLPLPPPPP